MVATLASATTLVKAPTISETEGQGTVILIPTSQQLPPTAERLKDFLAQEVAIYGNPKDFFTLEKLIQCESSWNPNAHNPNSTASGVAEFLDSTWNNYCGGNKDNPYDQIRCLVIEFKEHPSWWSESKWCWGEYITN
jgi:hypothetical protein